MTRGLTEQGRDQAAEGEGIRQGRADEEGERPEGRGEKQQSPRIEGQAERDEYEFAERKGRGSETSVGVNCQQGPADQEHGRGERLEIAQNIWICLPGYATDQMGDAFQSIDIEGQHRQDDRNEQ